MHITFIFADTMSVIETTVVVVSIIKMRDNDEYSQNATRACSRKENFSRKYRLINVIDIDEAPITLN